MAGLRRLLIVAALAAVAGPPVPAAAEPSGVAIEGVFRRSSCDDVCDPERDQGIKPGATVSGALQIHASATSDVLGLEWVRLEAQYASDPRFYCLQEWGGENRSDVSAYFNWDTRAWPGPETPQWGCGEATPHLHGEATANGVFRLRVTAREAVNREQASSGEFEIAVANRAPARPSTSASTGRGSGGTSPPPALATPSAGDPDPKSSPTTTGATARPSAGPSVASPGPARAAGALGPPDGRGPGRPLMLFLATVLLGLTARATFGTLLRSRGR